MCVDNDGQHLADVIFRTTAFNSISYLSPNEFPSATPSVSLVSKVREVLLGHPVLLNCPRPRGARRKCPGIVSQRRHENAASFPFLPQQRFPRARLLPHGGAISPRGQPRSIPFGEATRPTRRSCLRREKAQRKEESRVNSDYGNIHSEGAIPGQKRPRFLRSRPSWPLRVIRRRNAKRCRRSQHTSSDGIREELGDTSFIRTFGRLGNLVRQSEIVGSSLENYGNHLSRCVNSLLKRPSNSAGV